MGSPSIQTRYALTNNICGSKMIRKSEITMGKPTNREIRVPLFQYISIRFHHKCILLFLRRLSNVLSGSAGICACHDDQLKVNYGTFHNKYYAPPAFPFLLWNRTIFLDWGNFQSGRKSCVLTPATEKAPCEGDDQKEPGEKVDRVSFSPFFAINSQNLNWQSNWYQFDDNLMISPPEFGRLKWIPRAQIQ